jgi:hypothetical protein
VNPLFTHVVKLGCDDVDYVVWYGLWYKEVDHEGTGRHRVRRVDTGEVEVVNEAWRVVGRDQTDRKGDMEIETSGRMVYVQAIIVQFSPLSDYWVDMWGEHVGVEVCVVKSADGERALIRVRWLVGPAFAVEEL